MKVYFGTANAQIKMQQPKQLIKLIGILYFLNKNVYGQVSILNRTLTNDFSNFISNKVVTFNDKDPLQMASNLKGKLICKNGTYKDDLKTGKTN